MRVRGVFQLVVAAALIVVDARAAPVSLKLPQEDPLFSISFPEAWRTETSGSVVISRAADANMLFSVFPVTGAKNFQEAYAAAEKRAREHAPSLTPGKPQYEVEAGIKFYLAQGSGEKDSTTLRVEIGAFSPDAEHYFGLLSVSDEALVKTRAADHDSILNSLRPLKNLKYQSGDSLVVGFPQQNPVFVIKLPSGLSAEHTPDRLIAKSKGGHFVEQVTEVRSLAGGADDQKPRNWVNATAVELLKKLGYGELQSPQDVETGTGLDGSKTYEVSYFYEDGGMVGPAVVVCLFTLDGSRYFCVTVQYDGNRDGDGPIGADAR
ncbi:MAG TPA: hypothetical protein VF511_07680, partial [Chthoniobacterales bacterium]